MATIILKIIEKSTLYSKSVNNYWNAFYMDIKQ